MNRRNQRTQLPPKYTSPQVKSSFDGPLENDDYEEYEDDDQFELYENQQWKELKINILLKPQSNIPKLY